MTQERKEELETRVWQIDQVRLAIEAEIKLLQHGEFAREADVVFEIDVYSELVLKLVAVRSELESTAKFSTEDDIDILLGPPSLALVPPVDPFPYYAPESEDLRAIRPAPKRMAVG